jgi:putative phosphoesterase
MRALILADTHLRPGRMTLPTPVLTLLAGGPDAPGADGDGTGAPVDVVLHAGDLVDPDVLALLSSYGCPVRAVLGNNDVQLSGRLPERLLLDLDGVSVAMVHDSGSREGRARRLHRWFPTADLVVFGHSHLPLDEPGIDGQRLFNPGSPTERRRAPHHTCGLLDVNAGAIESLTLLDLGP